MDLTAADQRVAGAHIDRPATDGWAARAAGVVVAGATSTPIGGATMVMTSP
jgi:hypothetical protein